MRCLILAFFLLSLPALASDEQEVQRLQLEMDRLSTRNAWDGVERHFDSIVGLGMRPDRAHTLLAADAARHRGDLLSLLERLVQAQAMEASDEVQQRIDEVIGSAGRVQLVPIGPTTLSATQSHFRPDAAAAVRLASTLVGGGQAFDGFLPDGDYRLGNLDFSVVHGEDLKVVSVDSSPGSGSDITLANVSFPPKAMVGTSRLDRNGVGVRAKLFVNVYTAALYLPERTTSAELAIRQDVPKRLVMHVTFRKITKEQFVSHFNDDFSHVRGHEKTAVDIQTFVTALPDLVEGDRLTMDYLPGKGTSVSVNGKRVALIEGRRFMWVLFRMFLGDHPPTEKLKRGLLGG